MGIVVPAAVRGEYRRGSWDFRTGAQAGNAARERHVNRWSQIEWLVDGEGEITIGRVGAIRCAAVAADGHNALAMLVRRRGESLNDLLARLDDAIRLTVEEDTYTDEING
jgi:hypothetical protein